MDKYDINYDKSNDESYLIINTTNEKVESYQVKMIQSNNISLLLPLKLRHVDDEQYLYYQITSKINLMDYIKKEGLNYKLLYTIIDQLLQVIHQTSEFLLPKNSTIIDLRYIYIDQTENQCKFLYLPIIQNEMNVQNQLKVFIKEMFKMINKQDEETIKLLHQFKIAINENDFTTETFQNIKSDLLFQAVNEPLDNESKVTRDIKDEKEENYSMIKNSQGAIKKYITLAIIQLGILTSIIIGLSKFILVIQNTNLKLVILILLIWMVLGGEILVYKKFFALQEEYDKRDESY